MAAVGCSNGPATAAHVFPDDQFAHREIAIGENKFAYRIYIPKELHSGVKTPIMLYLHGSDERGSDNESQLSGPAPVVLGNPENFPFIIVFPQCPKGRFWDQEMIDRALAVLDQTINEFDGDRSRLYLAGFSLGGYGVWSTAATHPQKFAAVLPLSGRVLPRPGERKFVAPEILNLADAKDPYGAFALKLEATPIWIFHGANDNIVPVDSSRRMTKALHDAGNQNVRYSELADTGHVSYPAALSNAELFKWLSEQKLVSP